MSELKNNINPYVKLVKEVKCNDDAVKYLKVRLVHLLNYSSNLLLYSIMKSNKEEISNHPVLEWLKDVRKSLDDLKSEKEVVYDYFKQIFVSRKLKSL